MTTKNARWIKDLAPVVLGRIAEARVNESERPENQASQLPVLTGRHAWEVQELADTGYEGI